MPTPSPGDVTIEGITRTVASHGGKAPKLEFAAPNEDALPPSVLVLTATRVQLGRHSTIYHTVVLAINRRTSAAARARAASDNLITDKPNSLIEGGKAQVIHSLHAEIVFLFTGILPPELENWDELERARTGREKQEQADRERRTAEEWAAYFDMSVGAQPDANLGSIDPRACAALKEAAPPDGLFDTSLYDDGHAPTDFITELEKALEDSARDCRPGIGGLDSVLDDLDRDLGFGSDELGLPVSTPPTSLPPTTTPPTSTPGTTTPPS
ncbi:MAG TPA: hypothetical protein VKG38_06405 [Solirubrobacteraceae bacterium]|nr:hypothetical protein [Solirubrobacteraceae bacterium]